MTEWAEKHRRLSSEASARPGAYRVKSAPDQQGPMDAVMDPEVQSITLMWASQTGKTEVINNIVGFYIAQDPSPILCLQPTLEMATTWSGDRLAPMVRDTEVLKRLVADPKARDSGNTKLHKRFLGGHITMAGANSPASLAARPIRVLLCDEVDRYPSSAGTEGDPLSLAERRTDTFHNAIIIKTSTPTVKGLSKIELEYSLTDQNEWWCPCPKCGEHQTMKWRQVIWENEDLESAHYKCEHCNVSLTDEERVAMVMAGEWRAGQEFNGKRGYYLNGLCSVFPAKKGFKNRLHQAVVGFIESKKRGTEGIKTWTNTFMAEAWEDVHEEVQPHYLMARRETFNAEVPEGGVILTCGVDIQADRLETEVVAWGPGEESWGIEYRQFIGEPTHPGVWKNLDEYLQTRFETEDGRTLPIAGCCVDSGFQTQQVYQFVYPRQPRNIFAIKGMGGFGKPIVSRPTKSSVKGVRLYTIGTDTAKELIYGRLKIDEPGYGYNHFRIGNGYDEYWFEMLTSEKAVSKMQRGVKTRVWEKKSGTARNEALDVRIYAYCALVILNPNLEKLARNLEAEPETKQPKRQPRSPIRKGGFVGNFRS